MKELLMGNEAVALGALAAGVQVVSGYPGTPSTETLETIAKRNPGGVHVEWSVNEKAAAEVAGGAAFAGARSLVTMKQMGLNVAADPVMCLSYVGVKGGMVIYVCDDPGPISSQTEQDTRSFGRFAKIPVLDCSSPEQAYRLVQDAFALSEELSAPVILRSTTRVCHSCAVIDVPEIQSPAPAEGFRKDSRWVIFPRLSYQNKIKLVERDIKLGQRFADYKENELIRGGMSTIGQIGIVCGGISCAYVKDAIAGHEDSFTVLNVATPYPFPEELGLKILRECRKVIVFEELDPYIEDQLLLLRSAGHASIVGKHSGDVPVAGELDAVVVSQIIAEVSGIDLAIHPRKAQDSACPEMPVRPPVLCAGCPHRGAFYAVKRATAGRKATYCGDIGCYTLGNAMPLDMVDTCLCMGAGITMAQGLNHAERIGMKGADAESPDCAECPDYVDCHDEEESTLNFAFVGDSTFFASGITGVVNAVYNQADMILCILDNSTTAMTGHQPHPGIGVTMMGEKVKPVDMAKVLEGIGVTSIRKVDPLNLQESVDAVKAASQENGVRAIIFKSPCIAITKPTCSAFVQEEDCIGCLTCIHEIGCPALVIRDGKAYVDQSTCTGCGLCAQICPTDCIACGKEER